MLQVKLICVGKLRERFYIDAFEEYRKRLGAYCRLECVDIAEQRSVHHIDIVGLLFLRHKWIDRIYCESNF